MHPLLPTSNLILFFSLPFKPVGKFNLFFNGHIACALDGTVYHIVNPYLLKTDFLFSVMPTNAWLFGKGKWWVDRNPASPSYSHVFLYKKCESIRTVVYAAGISVAPRIIETIRDRFLTENRRFKSGARKYHFLHDNCSSIIADALVEAQLIGRSPLSTIPSFFFKHFVTCRRDMVQLQSVSCIDYARFSLHRFCYGLWGLNPKKSMDRWIASVVPQPVAT